MMQGAWARHWARRHGGLLEGQRIVERQPTAPDAQRWVGRVEYPEQDGITPGHGNTDWHGRTIQDVVERMNRDLGALNDAQYVIRE